MPLLMGKEYFNVVSWFIEYNQIYNFHYFKVQLSESAAVKGLQYSFCVCWIKHFFNSSGSTGVLQYGSFKSAEQ